MVSSSSEPNSPTEPATTTSWPKSVAISPASRSTGTSTPSVLATRDSASSRTSAPEVISRSPNAAGTASAPEIRKAMRGQPERRPAEPLRPHVLAGQEQQEAQAEQVEQLGRAAWLDQVQALRADREAGQHLEHHRRYQPPRHQPGQQRRHEGGHRHHQQAADIRSSPRPPGSGDTRAGAPGTLRVNRWSNPDPSRSSPSSARASPGWPPRSSCVTSRPRSSCWTARRGRAASWPWPRWPAASVDVGAEALLIRRPEGTGLIEAAGLGGELVPAGHHRGADLEPGHDAAAAGPPVHGRARGRCRAGPDRSAVRGRAGPGRPGAGPAWHGPGRRRAGGRRTWPRGSARKWWTGWSTRCSAGCTRAGPRNCPSRRRCPRWPRRRAGTAR